MTGEEILNVKMAENDAEAGTVKEYLKKLLEALWDEGEGFSGKRPFGNSGWEYELYGALEDAGASSEDDTRKMIFEAINAL
jgi:hypothetical protein